VIEPSAGADRATLAFLIDAYEEEAERTVLRFHPRIAPIKAAILPLVNKDGMPEMAERILAKIKKRWNSFYDDKGAIGRRYRRQDEVGTPFCFTVDGESAASQTVTVRERDDMSQKRIGIDQISAFLSEKLDEA
jgi:glycyl-tRNA synthetase